MIGLVVVPFAHLEHLMEQSFLKEYVGLGIALAIAFYALYTTGLRAIKNKWLLFVLGSMLASTAFVPPSGLVIGIPHNHGFIFSNINIENLWNYKPMLIGLIYLLMVCAIAYADLDEELIMKVISWVGFLMALVVIAQKFGFQEFWRVQTVGVGGELGGMKNPGLMGFMAQYTLVSGFMSICQLSALFQRKFWFAVVMGIAILLAGSHFGYLCIACAWGLWIVAENKNMLKYFFPVIFLSVVAFFWLFHKNDDGRFALWMQIYHDMTHPLYGNRMNESLGFFGYGAGAFSVFFPILHMSWWSYAHNEFMEFLFNNGIFGLGMLLASIVLFFRQSLKFLHLRTVQFCLFTFVIICIQANGTFVWHLGWGQFYTAVIVGVAYSAIRKEEQNVKASIQNI
jgi:hypothetical protein